MAKSAHVEFDSDDSATENDNESSLEETLKRNVPIPDVTENQDRDGPAGFVVPRDFVMIPSKGAIYPVD